MKAPALAGFLYLTNWAKPVRGLEKVTWIPCPKSLWGFYFQG